MSAHRPLTPRQKNPLRVQGMRVRIARIEKDWTQRDLAEQTDGLLTQQMISRIEKGVRDVKVSEMVMIASAVEKPIEFFVGCG